VNEQLTGQWSHKTECVTVRAVYRVIGSQQSWDAYNSYRYVALLNNPRDPRNGTDGGRNYSGQLEYYGQFESRGKYIGNECLLWHGTRRVCKLGESRNTTPCTNPSCSLCSIIHGSFDVTKVATNTGWARFGVGIYTSTRSSKWVHENDQGTELDDPLLEPTITRATSTPRTSR